VSQGVSEHITGRTFDMNLGIKNSSANAKSKAFEKLPAYQWLKKTAPSFGLSPYAQEPWHWSYNPTRS
jgi:LAS superfamily LD-carboxypeptidase LdcB